MRKEFNKETEQWELLCPAVIKSVNLNPLRCENAKRTPFLRTIVDVGYPDGTIKSHGALLWEKSHQKNPEAFEIGAKVDIAIQLDGEHRGKAKVQLPSLNSIDVDALMAEVELHETAMADSENIIKDNVILEEEVI